MNDQRDSYSATESTLRQASLSALLDRFQQGELSRQDFLKETLQLLEQPVTIDHVTLKTPDLQRASRFYQEVLGMPLLRADPGTHYLGAGNSRNSYSASSACNPAAATRPALIGILIPPFLPWAGGF